MLSVRLKFISIEKDVTINIMERIKATFHFSRKYEYENFKKEDVSVILEIDYHKESFSIRPAFGDEFNFVQCSINYKKWIAQLNCIQQAIDFGNVEIGVTPSIGEG